MGDGVQAIIAVNSATAALHLGLEALGVGPHDEVIVPTMTFTATAEVIRYLGATLIFVDMDPASFTVDVETRSGGNARTKVLMPVHFAGRSCDMTALRALAHAHGLHPRRCRPCPAHAPRRRADRVGGERRRRHRLQLLRQQNHDHRRGWYVGDRQRRDRRPRPAKCLLHGIDRDVFDRFTNIKASWAYDVVEAGYKYNLDRPGRRHRAGPAGPDRRIPGPPAQPLRRL